MAKFVCCGELEQNQSGKMKEKKHMKAEHKAIYRSDHIGQDSYTKLSKSLNP